MDLLLLSSVCHQVFYNLPVHQRLPAKEIHFQISVCFRNWRSGNPVLSFRLHKLISARRAMVLAFFCKAVLDRQGYSHEQCAGRVPSQQSDGF